VIARLLRVAVTLGLLALVLSRVNPAEMATLARTVVPSLVLLGFALHLVMVCLNAWRWQLLVRAQGTSLGLSRLIAYYFVCMFFNTFTPTSIGGDVARVIDLARHTGRRATALASVLIERVIGLLVLLPVSLLGLVLSLSHLAGHRWLFIYLEGILVGVLAVAFAFLRVERAHGTFRRVPILGALAERPGVKVRVKNVQEALDVYKEERRVLTTAFWISLLSRATWIVSCAVFGKALGIEIPVASYFLVIPLVEVARMVPISLSGIGVREGAIVFLMSFFGVSSSAALALSILIYAPFLVNGLAGGLLYAARGRERARDA
jgi:uncharacterized protein (TIRG00374 family)